VPLIDGDLAGDDGGAVAAAVLEDFQEVVAGRGVERLEAPVVEDSATVFLAHAVDAYRAS
jgi:hypothetical protein